MGKESSSNISRLAMRAMALFGGVQVMGILCSIVRTKLVALWIGPAGVGLFGLFNNALDTINTAANMGVRQSSVRDLSQASEAGDAGLLARMVAVVRRWSLWLGLAGATATMALAPWLSQLTFGDQDHLWGFVALAAAVLLSAVTNGEFAVLQGTAQLKRLARCTLAGTVIGLAVSVPLFWWLREQSIVPSIVAYAVGVCGAALVMRHRSRPSEPVTAAETWRMGSAFVRLGVMMTVGNFVTLLAGYLFNAWLNQHAGTAQVGYYQAGYTLVYKYTGLVLTALGMEYYPRLARVAHSRLRLRVFVSQEINIAMLVMAPIAAAFILLRQPVIWLLYSPEFAVIGTFASWVMVGTVLRALSWCIAFVILAKGSGRVYLVTESLSAVAELALNITCYSLWGLTGLGVSFVLWYVFYSLLVWGVYRWHYGLRLSAGCWGTLSFALGAAFATLAAVEAGLTWVGIVLALATAVTAAWQLKRQFSR